MTTFLVSVSFIINIVLILAVVLLYLRQNRFLEVEKNQTKLIKELEEIISGYAIQLKEENEQFLNRMKELNKSPIPKPTFEIENKNKEEINESPYSGNIPKQYVMKAYQNNSNRPSIPENNLLNESILSDLNKETMPKSNEQKYKDDLTEPILEEILQLKENGLSNDEIAKKLNKGKTEIELLLKFYQKTI